MQGEVGEILAGAGRIERGIGDVAGGIDVNADGDADHAMNGGEGFLGDVGQNLVEDFTARERRRGSARRICGRERIGAHGSRGWRGTNQRLDLFIIHHLEQRCEHRQVHALPFESELEMPWKRILRCMSRT